jgi:hypothetical protein
MRAFATWLLALGLAAAPAMAGTGSGDKDSSSKPNDDTKSATTTTNSSDKPAAAPAAAAPSSLESELQQLRELIEAQSRQLQEQNQQLRLQQQRMQIMETELTSSSSKGPAAGENADSSMSAPASRSILVNNAVPIDSTMAGEGQGTEDAYQIHFKGITLTPTGFSAAETVWRGKAVSADINTPFNSVPLPGTSASNVSEFNASGRQSRIGMLAQGKLGNVTIGSYYEGDFLGGGSTSNDNQSNSYVFRQRQFWGQAKFDNGFTVTGGQMWSLITETGKGLENRTEQTPLTIDPQYTVGFSWARQYGVRFAKSFWDDKLTFGLGIEESQTTFTVHGNPTSTVTTGQTTVLVPTSTTCPVEPCTALVGGTSTTYVNFLMGQAGVSGGLYNPLANYSYNAAPDIIVKAALDALGGHYEVFGVVSQFRDRIFPCAIGITATTPCPIDGSTAPSAVGAFNDSRTGGGVGANARWQLLSKRVELGVHFLGGSGVGRYGTGGLSDATVRPDGTIALLHNYQALGTIQIHPTPKLDIYLNAGGEYASRAAYLVGTKGEGYGSPLFSNAGCWTETLPTTTVPAGTTASQGYIPGALGSCTGDTRNLLEGTVGFWYRFYKGPKGAVAVGMQGSYVVRNTWSGVGSSGGSTGYGVSGQPAVSEPMWFTSFRYYLP